MAGIGKSVATRIFSSMLTSTTDVPKEAEARVTRVDEDGVPWVAVAGSDEETPANGSVTSEAQVGQTVRVSVQGGRLSIVGNSTSPSVGGEYVRGVVAPVEELVEETSIAVKVTSAVANAANTVAQAAQAIAQATNQHFWHDGQGVHVTEAAGDATTEHNVLINSLGFLLRKATAPLMALSASAVAFYDGLGDTAANIVARFGKDGSQIGRDGESHVELDYHSLKLIDKEGSVYFHVSDLRDTDGYAQVREDTVQKWTTSSTVDTRFKPKDIASTSVSINGVAATVTSIGSNYVDYSPNSVAGDRIVVTYQTNSDLIKCFTFGRRASNSNKGPISFVAGLFGEASGHFSSAFGYETTASGLCSLSAGSETIAAGSDQIALGHYNVSDTTHALIIGNGTSDTNRSNAFAVGWDGTIEMGTDIPWTLVTLDAACHAYNDVSANTPRYRRWGQLVTVTGIIAPTSEVAAGGILSIATLPAVVRPRQEINVKCQGSVRAAWNLKITAAGVMSAQRYGDETGALPMNTNIWMPFTATYLI